jgi:protein-L-isoaspartate(D-aspartate) O-methyltransferase
MSVLIGEGGSGGRAKNHRRANPLSPLGVMLLALGTGVLGCRGASQDAADFAAMRKTMVARQIAARGIRDALVLQAMSEVPRHLFVPADAAGQAYGDHPLPIGEGQTISQPYIVALMTESLALKGGEKVLEVGTGSGYQAAVLGRIAGSVFSIEIDGTLARRAAETLERLGFGNVHVRAGDGFFGWPDEAPELPPALFAQLAEGGRLVIPLGDVQTYQRLTVVTKRNGKPVIEQVLDVRFVPMTGEILKKKR